ncbi:hypothetical protein [Polaromonas sp. A23]|uniref:hypothetical protein n=1 Tax=Polaromonas sp. A23 TaxID=1944133 RepID=UPI00098516B7|nr:hypothetical protein [Polaromonas sp. A23]OOG37205.1 hypothetical protein B0B52_18800 [Polaromonas sp. A23]
MSENSPIPEYRTSWYGRFGYLIMATASSVMFAPMALLFLPGPFGSQLSIPLAARVVAGLSLFLLGWLLLLCLRRLLGPGRRVAIYPRGFIYQGLFGAVRVLWADIDSYWLGYGGRSPFLFLYVRLKDGSGNRKRKFKLDVSGLNPGAEQLTEEFLKRTGLKPKPSTTY